MSEQEESRQPAGMSPAERVPIVRRELLARLAVVRELVARLSATDPELLASVFRGRFDELAEILSDSAATLQRLLEALPETPPARFGEEELHTLRHDLLGPVGTLRGVALVLGRAESSAIPGLPAEFPGWVRALVSAMDELRDTAEALTRKA